jgi:aconitase A
MGFKLHLRAGAAVFQDLAPESGPLRDIEGARLLVKLGDSVTTDHISPAGSIPGVAPRLDIWRNMALSGTISIAAVRVAAIMR